MFLVVTTIIKLALSQFSFLYENFIHEKAFYSNEDNGKLSGSTPFAFHRA